MVSPEQVLYGGTIKLSRMVPSLQTSLGSASLWSDERRKAIQERREKTQKVANESVSEKLDKVPDRGN